MNFSHHLRVGFKHQCTAAMLEEFRVRGRGLYHGTIGANISTQYRECGTRRHGTIETANHVRVEVFGASNILTQRFSRDGQRVEFQMRTDFLQQRRHSARKEKVFHQFVARGKQICEDRNLACGLVHFIKCQAQARAPGNRDEVNGGVGGTAERHIGIDAIG